MNGAPGNAHTGEVGRRRRHVLDRPLHEERLGELVSQEAEARDLGRVAVRLRAHLEDVDDQQVTRFGALDVDGTGERVEEVQVDVADLDRGGAGVELAVERVTRLQQDLVAGYAGDGGCDVGVPAVVPERGFGRERDGAVDADLVLGHGLLRCGVVRWCGVVCCTVARPGVVAPGRHPGIALVRSRGCGAMVPSGHPLDAAPLRTPHRYERKECSTMEMKIEVVVIPVSDVDRASDFYKSLGWRLDADVLGDDEFRLVQLTPPGSRARSISAPV